MLMKLSMLQTDDIKCRLAAAAGMAMTSHFDLGGG